MSLSISVNATFFPSFDALNLELDILQQYQRIEDWKKEYERFTALLEQTEANTGLQADNDNNLAANQVARESAQYVSNANKVLLREKQPAIDVCEVTSESAALINNACDTEALITQRLDEIRVKSLPRYPYGKNRTENPSYSDSSRFSKSGVVDDLFYETDKEILQLGLQELQINSGNPLVNHLIAPPYRENDLTDELVESDLANRNAITTLSDVVKQNIVHAKVDAARSMIATQDGSLSEQEIFEQIATRVYLPCSEGDEHCGTDQVFIDDENKSNNKQGDSSYIVELSDGRFSRVSVQRSEALLLATKVYLSVNEYKQSLSDELILTLKLNENIQKLQTL